MHECPRCGHPTEGVYDEDGVLWDVCEECLLELNQETDLDYMEEQE